jgi:YbbR domain-containing protein
MKKYFDKPWFYRIIAFLIALLLVVYIDSTQVSQGQPGKTQQTASESRTISVPLQVSVNTDQYYVEGYPEKVKINLQGSAALVTSTVNTQNFRVYLDLTHLSVGKHQVRVKVSGLSNQLSYRLDPARVTVNIQQRKSRTMPVQIGYNKNAVADGYQVGQPTADPDKVEVTGAVSEVNQVDEVVAQLSVPNNTQSTLNRQVMLVAKNKKGQQLNVVIEPAVARITLPISLSKKQVHISLNSRNEDPNLVYSLTAKTNQVTLYGERSSLAKIKNLRLNVDLSKVMESTTRSYPVTLPRGVAKSDPTRIQVEIKVRRSNQEK